MGRWHVLALCLAWAPVAAEPKISVVTALLPPRGKGGGTHGTAGAGARLRVEASGGCFRWISQRPDLVALEEPLPEELPPRRAADAEAEAACQEACLHAGRQFLVQEDPGPAGDGCQPVAIIRSLADSVDHVEKILILAQDIHSSVELRCEVYIANIERIEVETSVRRINVDDVETLGVKAYDKQGNVFSSLEGLQFRWHIGDPMVLQRPKLVDSAFKLSPVRRALAEAGSDPDTVLLRGVATGRTTVGANLTLAGMKPVISPDVPLTVLENIVVLPSLLRAPPMAHLQLHLKVLRGPRRPLEEFPSVPLPAAHFSWRVQALEGGRDVLHVQPQLGHVVTQRLGSGRILVVDSRIENNTAASIVHVSEPASLRFSTRPLWRGTGVPIDARTPGWLGSLEGGWEDAELHVLRSERAGVSSAEPLLQLVQGRTYALRLELLDDLSQSMQIPLNLRAQTRCVDSNDPVSAPLLQLLHQASNAAVVIFRAVELGEGEITIEDLTLQADSEDQARGLKTLALQLTAKQAFRVVAQLRPEVPVSGPMLLPRWHSYLLKVTGGSGQQAFTLTQQPVGVASVSEGRVQAFGRLGNAELLVHDVRNPENNFTLPIFVRRAGYLQLLPHHLQIRLPPEGLLVEEAVRVQARAEDVEDAHCHTLRNLTFWNCTALFPSDQLVAEVSNKTVASVRAVSSGEFATCATLRLRPLAKGRFQLFARAQEADAPTLAGASLPFEVYKPLEWELLEIPSSAEVLSAAQANQSAPLVVSPCSSIRLRLSEGPLGLTVPGLESWNLTAGAGAQISVHRLGQRVFQVFCVQVTPGPVRLVGEVSHVPADLAHGDIFVDNLTLWLRCSVPARVQAVAQLSDVEDLDDTATEKDRGAALGVQRGRETPFRARFADAFGRTILNASEYWLRWSLLPTGAKEGVPFQKVWLSASEDRSLASLLVPRDATIGATAQLKLEVSLPPSSHCASAATLAALPLPSGDDLGLVVARKLELRWPGHPQTRFAMFKNLSIVLEAGFGTGRANLELLTPEILEVLKPSQICGDVPDGKPCIPALWIGSPCNVTRADVQRWFLKPLAQGTASVALWDPDLLGARPQRLELTIRAAKQLDLGLLGEDPPSDGTTVLVVRGVRRELQVEIRDAEGEALHMVNWAALQLKLRSSDPGAFEVRESSTRCGQYECICNSAGIHRLSAEMQDYPSGTIYSRVLHVHCLPEFRVVLQDIVVMPGQAFELAFTGGPSRSDERTFFRFTSSDPRIASIDEGDGLVIALTPGTANLSVQLLERHTHREIARAGAHVTVGIPWNASVDAVGFLAGQERTSPGVSLSPWLRRGGPEPLRLRARLWTGAKELTPVLLAMASGQAAPSFQAGRSQAVYRAALDAGEPVVEAVEAASAVAQRLALEEGLGLVADTASAGAALGIRCRFRWASESSVLLQPVGLGALAVDVVATATTTAREVDVTVLIDCPLGSGHEQLHLQARAQLPVVQPLQLLAPAANACAAAVDAASLLVPLQARLPLLFNLPRSHLQVEVVPSTRGVHGVIQLLETGDVVELEAGSEEGESTVHVQAIESELRVPAIQVSVFARKVFAARLDSVPSRLPLGTSVTCPLHLVDAAGQTMALPSNFQVDILSSHTTVIAEAHRTSSGASLYVRPVSEGCTLLSVAVRVPDGRQLPSDIAELCVVRGALVGQGPLLVQPGARLNLDAEELVAGRAGSGRAPLAFALRIAQLPSRSLAETAGKLASDLATALAGGLSAGSPGAGPGLQVGVIRARWSPEQEADESLPGAEVDLEVSARDLAEAAGRSAELGLRDLAEILWKHQDRPENSSLRLLDFGWGVRAAGPEAPGGLTRCSGCCAEVQSRCRSCCSTADGACGNLKSADVIAGWHSLQPRVVRVEGPRVVAVAQEPGVATLRYCDGIVAADVQVTVAHAAQLLVASAPQGGPSTALAAQKIFSNEAGAEPQKVKFAVFREGGSSQPEDQFLSGPFLAQNLQLQCEPTEVAMRDFFSFKAVDDTCVLTAKEPSTWQRPAPDRLGLAASLPGSSGGGAVVEWPFTPQFRIIQANRALASGQVCATLSTSNPRSTVIVWTGGNFIQAELGSQIRNARRGNISVEVRASDKPLAELHVFWHGAVDWGISEEVQLTVLSPATSQVSTFRVRIEPTKQVDCSKHDGRSVLEFFLLALAIAALLWLLARSYSRPPTDGLGAAFQGVGAGPVFSGDPFGGPRAVSPFHALG